MMHFSRSLETEKQGWFAHSVSNDAHAILQHINYQEACCQPGADSQHCQNSARSNDEELKIWESCSVEIDV